MGLEKVIQDAGAYLSRLARPRVVSFGLLPFIVYFALFCLLTWPAITKFSSHLYGDAGDGVQNLWNISHVRESVASFQSPFFAPELHSPAGTTLLGHTLSPVNSFTGAALESFLSPFQSYNTLVIFSFCATGLAGFLLAYYFCRSYWPSLIAGFIYGFSGYQMLHIGSHINLTSLEWLPIFLIFFHLLLTQPRLKWALLAWLFLALTFYSELYYFFYGFVLALLFTAGLMIVQGGRRFLDRRQLVYIGLFLLLAVLTLGPYVYAFMSSNLTDPFQDNHDAVAFSADALGPFMPGPLKAWYATQIKTGEGLGENFLGLSVLFLMGYAIIRRKHLPDRHRFLWVWFSTLALFYLLSLGPALQYAGHAIGLPMPWDVMLGLAPFLKVAAMPNRMFVISIMAASVISAMAMAEMIKHRKFPAPLLAVIALLVLFEYNATFNPQQPSALPYAYALRDIPGKEAVFEVNTKQTTDRATLLGEPLLDQMVHGRPIFGGYISRRPLSVMRQDAQLLQALQAGNLDRLCQSGFRYIVTDGPPIPGAELKFSDPNNKLYDLITLDSYCREKFS